MVSTISTSARSWCTEGRFRCASVVMVWNTVVSMIQRLRPN